jgi:uncharacterized protein YjiS (DUF1127 family)
MTTMTTAWTKYRSYRRTLSELRALPQGRLLDLGIKDRDLAGTARRAVYGR